MTLTLKNSGQTPAKEIVSWLQVDVIEPRHEETLIVPPLKRLSAISLGAGTSFPKYYWHPRQLNAQEIADILVGTKRIYVYGRAEYIDIFGLLHHTNFRFFYKGPFPNPAGAMVFTTSDGGNGFD